MTRQSACFSQALSAKAYSSCHWGADAMFFLRTTLTQSLMNMNFMQFQLLKKVFPKSPIQWKSRTCPLNAAHFIQLMSLCNIRITLCCLSQFWENNVFSFFFCKTKLEEMLICFSFVWINLHCHLFIYYHWYRAWHF